ncbi:CHRD domain-containing protein [Sphingomonas sp. PR090111-T3T-6A]|uniref:CHRD domain-containing protein n=1 Tax=Sphingomonas sp. PR090111-T3T-6A TaxID=685778 RepID=UPI000377094B|nr:CHRD domain-containing protein [Sphingomonas sp. PR090111-T3T-6A]
MKVGFATLAAVSAICLTGAAPALAETVHYSAQLDGKSEVPANTTGGKGVVKAELNTATRAFTYTITYSGLTGPASAAHFHGPAAAGVNAPPVIAIKSLASPIKGKEVLTPEQMADLQAGKWYFNVHTKANPGGEIRGQLAKP